MAEPLKKLNYFTGQFLEEEDFVAEQLYHERMGRMLTYATFTAGVLNGLAVTKIDGGRVLIQKGVAIDALENSPEGDQESRAIVLTQDQTINLRSGLDGRGFSDGDEVFLYTTYREDPTDGAVGRSTRLRLREEVLTVRDSGAGFGLNTNLYILLGKIALVGGDLTILPVDTTNRLHATLRLGGGSTAPGAVLVSISIQPTTATLNVGNNLTFQARGNFNDSTTRPLSAPDGLTWSSSATSILSIDGSTGQGVALSVGGPVTITAAVGAIAGTAMVQVQPVINPPVITNFSPRRAARGFSPVIIDGANFAGAQVTFDFINAPILVGSTDTRMLTAVPTAADGLNPNPNGILRVSNAGGSAEVSFEIRP